MLANFLKKFSSTEKRTEADERVYAIGDVHGRLDLLQGLFKKLEDFDQALPPVRDRYIILLGDLVDRGPQSAQVLKFVSTIQKRTNRLMTLMGNHEKLMLGTLDASPGSLRVWLRNGGDATFRSFGIDPDTLGDNPIAAADALAQALPKETAAWLRKLPLSARSGDYVFCHAGIRPGVPIKAQKAEDMLWIREEFLKDERDHGAIIVHGHSIAAEVQIHANRIGIDTGAYHSGVLTALYLEGAERQFISMSEAELAGSRPFAPAAMPSRENYRMAARQ